MNEPRQQSATSDGESAITLGLLSAVEENSGVTQRSLARELGIALGLTNAYLKRCIRKGWIKVRMAPANRYAYYLTPRGFAEKSQLTARYLSISFNFFRAAREQCSEVFAQCARKGWRRVLLIGAHDLGEIATLCADEHRIELVGVLDPTFKDGEFAGLPVVADIAAAAAHDAVMITDLKAPQAAFDRLIGSVPAERVLAPRMLNISRVRPRLAK